MSLPGKGFASLRAKVSLPAVLSALRSPLRLWRYWGQRRRYLALPGAERHWHQRAYPMLHDETGVQDAKDFYYYQDCWGARKVFELKPASVLDLGCTVLLTGVISQFTPTTSVDIRPVQSRLPGLTNLKGDLMALPIPDASQSCVMSLCVIEHVCLGRYGDALDPAGSRKAASLFLWEMKSRRTHRGISRSCFWTKLFSRSVPTAPL